MGGGIRYMAEGGVTGAGCIPLPVPENVRLASEIYPSRADETRGTTFVFEEIDRERFLYHMIVPFHLKKYHFRSTIVFYLLSYNLRHICAAILYNFSHIDN